MLKRDPNIKCGACGLAPENGKMDPFCGVPVCNSCRETLGLSSLGHRNVPSFLSDLIENSGTEAAYGLESLSSRMPKGDGWDLFSNIHGMTLSLKDQTSKELLRGSLILVGATIIMSGSQGERGKMDIKALTLSLVLGEVLCLSIMKRISRDNGLTSSGRLDDVLITAMFRSRLSGILLDLRPIASPEHDNELASAVWTLLG